jgi:DNA modification methylase
MTVRLILDDVRAALAAMPASSVDCVVCSPPYWGLRSYLDAADPNKPLEIGLEPSLGEHLDTMVAVFRLVRRVLRPHGTVWLNYGDCYAAAPNGKSAAAYKADGSDDRTFRDKPFSTVGPVRGGRTHYGGADDGSRGADRDFHDAHRPKAGPIRAGAHDGDEAWGRAFDGDERAAARAQAGPIFDLAGGASGGGARGSNKGNTRATPEGRVVAGGYLKPKDLCMIPNRLAIALQDDGWWVRSEIVWHKPSPMPESVFDRPTNAHEKIWLLTKRQDYYYNHEAVREPVSGGAHKRVGKNSRENVDRVPRSRKPGVSPKSAPRVDEVDTRALRNVWTIPSRGYRGAHFATFPERIAERCVLAGTPPTVCGFCGRVEGCKAPMCSAVPRVAGTVLDPFAGSGTVGAVADRLGLNAVLVDLKPEYLELARARIFGDPPPDIAEAAE